MQKVKSFGKRSLSLFLALLMCLSCFAAGFTAVSAYSPDPTQPKSRYTKYDRENIAYNSLDWAVYNNEQVATALLDNLDKILPTLNIKMVLDLSVMTINVDLRSVNAVFGTIREVSGKIGGVKGMLGSLKNLNLSAADGVSRENKTSVEIVQALITLIYNNNGLIREFLDGSLSLGIANSFIPGGGIYNLIGNALGVSFDTNNLVYSLVKPIMVKALYPNTNSAEYAAAMNKTLDNFVFQDVLDAAFNPVLDENGNNVDTGYPTVKFWDPTIVNTETGVAEGGWALLLPGFKMEQTDNIGDALYRAVTILWDNCLKKLISTIKFEPWFDQTHNEIVADGKIDVTTLFGKLLYNNELGEGVLNLNFSDSTILTDASFDFTKYTSIYGGFNDFLAYLLPYFFPNYEFSNWAKGDISNLLPNLEKLLGYVCDAIDPDILSAVGGAAGLKANNLEQALLPFAKALLKHLAPVVHDDTLAKIVDFESLAKYGAMVYANQILPSNTYSESDTYLDVVRDITAYQMGDTIPLYKANSMNNPNANIYDVYASNNEDTLWDVLNYVLCYYAEDRGIANLIVTGDNDSGTLKTIGISRSNSLWTNLDKIVNCIPLFKDLLNNGNDISTEQLLLNDVINSLMNGNIEPLFNKFVGIFNSNTFTNGKVLEVIYNNLRALLGSILDRGYNFIPTYSESPFDKFLQRGVINPFIQSAFICDIYVQRDFLWTPLMFLLQTIGGFVPGFLDEIEEQAASTTSVSVKDTNYTGTLSFKTTATITNNSYGNDRSATVGYKDNGEAKRVYDNKYKSKVRKFEVLYNGQPLAGSTSTFNGATVLASLDSFNVDITGTLPASGIVTIKVTYDVLGEDSSTIIAADKVATSFITLSNQSSYFDSVYAYNADTSKYEFKAGASISSWGTGLGSTNGASFSIDAPHDFMLEGDKLNQTAANSVIKLTGAGFPTEVTEGNAVNIKIDGAYAVDPSTSDADAIGNMAAALVDKNENGDWLDADGNVVLQYDDLAEISGSDVSKIVNRTGIKGINFALKNVTIGSNSATYVPFLEWDGSTKVAPGKYDIKFVTIAGGSQVVNTATVYVADTDAYSLNSSLEDGQQPYHGRGDLQAVYNNAFAVYNKYSKSDFTTGYRYQTDSKGEIVKDENGKPIIIKTVNGAEAWNKVEGLLTKSLTTISTPIDKNNFNSLANTYNAAYDELKDAYDDLMCAMDKSIANQVQDAMDKDYSDVDFIRTGYGSMIKKANAAHSLAASGTASSFEIGEAVRQYKLAVSRMITRQVNTVKIDSEIARSSNYTQDGIAPTRWADYQKALATAIEYSEKANNGGDIDHFIVRDNTNFNPDLPIPTDSKGNEILVSDKADGLNTKQVKSSYRGPVLQSDVNAAMWDLMVTENSLDLADRMTYTVTDIVVTPPAKVTFTKGDTVTAESMIADGLKVIANIADVEEGSLVQGPTMDVTSSAVISAVDTSVSGKQTVNVTYTDMAGITHKASFEINVVGKTYAVNFHDDEEAYGGGTIVSPQTVNEGAAAVDPYTSNPTIKEALDNLAAELGLVFIGWDKDFSNVTSDMEIYPVFGDARYTITYNVDSDTTINGEKVEYFVTNPDSEEYVAEIQLPTAEKVGYQFLGWCTDEATATTPFMVLIADEYSDNVNLYPKFEAQASGYKVTGYISAMQSLADQEVSADKKVVIKDATVTLYGDDGVTAVEGVSPVVNDAKGYFEFTGIKNGTYVLVISGGTALTRAITVTVNGADVAVSTADRMIGIINADLTNDGYITSTDYINFSKLLGTNTSSANWNPAADMNGDGYVNSSDFVIYSSFLGTSVKTAYKNWVIK